MSAYPLAWIVLLLLSFADLAMAGYRVIRVEGQVWTRSPHASRWQRVAKGKSLATGQLVQVGEDGFLVIEDTDSLRSGRLPLAKARLSMPANMMVRLSPDLLRDMRLSPLWIERAALGVTGQKLSPESIIAKLSEAWARILASFTPSMKQEFAPENLELLAQQGLALGVSAHKIKLLTPLMNDLRLALEFPISLQLQWQRPAAMQQACLVYLWPVDSPRGEPVVETDLDHYALTIAKPAIYYVQVTSIDGLWASPAHAVHLLQLDKLQRLVSADVAGKQPSFQATYPPANAVIVHQGPSQDVLFSWEGGEANVEFKLSHATGETLRTLRGQARQLHLQLPPGRYHWAVRAVGSQAFAEERQLEILALDFAQQSQQRLQLMQRLLSEPGQATLLWQ